MMYNFVNKLGEKKSRKTKYENYDVYIKLISRLAHGKICHGNETITKTIYRYIHISTYACMYICKLVIVFQ